MIDNPGEANSVSLVRSLEELAPGKGFQVVEAAAPKSSDASVSYTHLDVYKRQDLDRTTRPAE